MLQFSLKIVTVIYLNLSNICPNRTRNWISIFCFWNYGIGQKPRFVKERILNSVPKGTLY